MVNMKVISQFASAAGRRPHEVAELRRHDR
jgi:hypothetical protein